MKIKVSQDAAELGKAAAKHASDVINACIAKNGRARIVLSTGASQFELFKALAQEAIDWSRVDAFHLDEYIGLPAGHKASFSKYLKERFVDVVKPGSMHYVSAEGDIAAELEKLSKDLTSKPVDVGFIGIGENAHLAFNDPPADFNVTDPYIVVTLNETCKAQQVREGWFENNEAVPKQAISMSIDRIMRCKEIISCVPGAVKAQAIHNMLTNSVTSDVPATKLKEHANVTVYLDKASAGLLSEELLAQYSK